MYRPGLMGSRRYQGFASLVIGLDTLRRASFHSAYNRPAEIVAATYEETVRPPESHSRDPYVGGKEDLTRAARSGKRCDLDERKRSDVLKECGFCCCWWWWFCKEGDGLRGRKAASRRS